MHTKQKSSLLQRASRLVWLLTMTTLVACTEQPPTDPTIEPIAPTPVSSNAPMPNTAIPAVTPTSKDLPNGLPKPRDIKLSGQPLQDALKRLDKHQAFHFRYQRGASKQGVGLQASGRLNGSQVEIKQRYDGGTVEQVYLGVPDLLKLKTDSGFENAPDGADAMNRLNEFIRFCQSTSGQKGEPENIAGVVLTRYQINTGAQQALLWVDEVKSQISKASFVDETYKLQEFEFFNYGKLDSLEAVPASAVPGFRPGTGHQ